MSPKCAARQTTQLCHLPEPKVAPLHIWQGIPVRERTTARKTAPRPQVAREPHCLVQRSAMSITSPAAEAQSAQGCQEPGSSGYGWRDTRAWVPGWCGRSGGLSHPRASLGRGWAFGALVIVTRVRPMSSLCLATFLNHFRQVPDSSVARPTKATQEIWTCVQNSYASQIRSLYASMDMLGEPSPLRPRIRYCLLRATVSLPKSP